MGKAPRKRRSKHPRRGELVSRPPGSAGSPTSGPVGNSSSDELATTSPHDELFKATFKSIEEARSLLRSALPRAVSRRIDWSTLRLEPTEHIDSHLTKRYGDLHFRARLAGQEGREVYIEVALEHQSTPDRMMALRVLGIIVRRTEDLLRQPREQRKRQPDSEATASPERLPIVLPVVVFQGEAGKKTPWRYPIRYSELLDADTETLAAFQPFIPDFEFVLDDLPRQSDADLEARELTDATLLTLWLLANVGLDDATLLQRLRQNPSILGVFQRLARDSTHQVILVSYYRYLYRTVDVDNRAIHDLAHEQGENAKEAEMTAAQRLIEQGLEKGLEQGLEQGLEKGRAEGAAATLERQISLKFGGADDAVRTRLANASAEELALWTDRILSAQSLDELFAD